MPKSKPQHFPTFQRIAEKQANVWLTALIVLLLVNVIILLLVKGSLNSRQADACAYMAAPRWQGSMAGRYVGVCGGDLGGGGSSRPRLMFTW